MGRIIAPLLGLAFVFCALPAHASVQTLTSRGVPVRWPGGFKFNLAGNPTNSSGLSDSDFFSSVVHALERWNMASQGEIRFDYWQGRDSGIYEPNSNYNGLSSVYFSSNANGPTGLTPNILGLTQVWYSTDSGQILEADTVLNDQSFVFTEDPTDTSGFGSGLDSNARARTRNHVFVENVLTHEFGNSLGLSHSGTLQATMLYMESPEQAHLGCDEQTGIHALYPSADAASRATITGSVVAPDGSPVFGANVAAISRRRGTILGGAMTDPGGRYAIGGLEPGAYFIMAEPYFAGPQPLPAFYAHINAGVCPNKDAFGRTILVDASGYKAEPVMAPEGGSVDAPTLQVGCNSGEASVSGPPLPTDPAAAPEIFDGLRDTGFGATDRFKGSQSHYYRLSDVSGHLEIRAMSYSLYSPVRLDITLVDSTGRSVPAQSISPVYEGDSGYVNYDSALIADDLAKGTYYVEASPSPLGTELFPAGQISLDSSSFALITGTMNEEEPTMREALPFNARCRMQENFTAYQSPPGLPPRAQTQSSDNSGGCSILSIVAGSGGGSSGRGPRDGGGGPGSPGAVGWFIPWLMMAFVGLRPWRLARRYSHG